MSLFAQVDNDIKEAMRARETDRVSVLRMLKSAMKAKAIEKGLDENTMDENITLAILRKELKQRQDSIESFEKGNRPDLASKEKLEAEILSKYLPAQLTAGELHDLVEAVIKETGATSKAQMGAVMKLATERAAGRADGRAISAVVNQLLA